MANAPNNSDGTPASKETNGHSVTEAQTVPKSYAERAAENRATPLIKPVPDTELRRWLNASLLSRMAQTTWRIVGHFLYRIYLKFSVSGLENVPAKGSLIIVSNHSSLLDFGALIFALNNRKYTVHPLAARELFFNTPVRRWASHVLLNALPFDRESHFGECFVLALGVLQQGHSIILFPEGDRTRGVMKPFKRGVGLLAVESGVPVLPAYISGAYQSMPRGRIVPRPYRVHVRFGEPVVVRKNSTDESPSKLVRRVTDDVQRAVKALSKQPL